MGVDQRAFPCFLETVAQPVPSGKAMAVRQEVGDGGSKEGEVGEAGENKRQGQWPVAMACSQGQGDLLRRDWWDFLGS